MALRDPPRGEYAGRQNGRNADCQSLKAKSPAEVKVCNGRPARRFSTQNRPLASDMAR